MSDQGSFTVPISSEGMSAAKPIVLALLDNDVILSYRFVADVGEPSTVTLAYHIPSTTEESPDNSFVHESMNEKAPLMSKEMINTDPESGVAKAPRTADPMRSMRPVELKAMRVLCAAFLFYVVGSVGLNSSFGLDAVSEPYTYIGPASMLVGVVLYIAGILILVLHARKVKCRGCWKKCGAVRTPYCAFCGIRDPVGDYEEWFEQEKLKNPEGLKKTSFVERIKQKMGRGRVEL